MTTHDEILFTTPRLTLRRVQSDDFSLFHRLFCLPDMMRYLGAPWSEEECRQTLEEWRDEWGTNNYYYGVMVCKDTHEAIGVAGISEDTNPDEPGIEFSWFVLPEHQGRGYASEITLEWLAFVFDELKKERLFAETHPENSASNRVLEKCGFKKSGERNHKFDYLPEFDRQVLWEFRREDWKGRSA